MVIANIFHEKLELNPLNFYDNQIDERKNIKNL